jgi:two-component system chemotaxis response regulator CheB
MESHSKIRVLVIDDSETLRRFALRVLEGTGRFEVVGLASSGRGVVRSIERHEPDLVLLDMQMPEVDGLEATRAIMSERPKPVVLFCGVGDDAAQRRALEALDAGAISLVPKPGSGQTLEGAAEELIRVAEMAARVRLVTRRHARPEGRSAVPVVPRLGAPRSPAPLRGRAFIAIGASTGGPPALREVLRGLEGHDVPPVLVVQHIVAGFLENLVGWLGPEIGRPVAIAHPGMTLERGRVYFAPSGGHLVVQGGRAAIDVGPPVSGHRPSADVLFGSVAKEAGATSAGVLLTGMGEDGARGLLELRDAGAETFAQDEATSIVYGMPRAARELGAARRILPVWAIAPALLATPARP